MRFSGRVATFVQHLGKTEVLVDLLQQGGECGALVLQLVFGTENVAVVLGETAHPHHAMQRAGRFVAVALPELAVTQRQFAIGMQAGIEDLHVPGAVHGLQTVDPVFGLGREHVFAVVVPVARLLPERQVEDLRRLDLLVAVVLVHLAHVLLDLLPQRPALRMPEDQPGASSWKWNRSSSRPILRWSRRSASSSMCR